MLLPGHNTGAIIVIIIIIITTTTGGGGSLTKFEKSEIAYPCWRFKPVSGSAPTPAHKVRIRDLNHLAPNLAAPIDGADLLQAIARRADERMIQAALEREVEDC